MNALTFRPRLALSPDSPILPVPLMLPDNGCDWLALSGDAYLVSWLARPWAGLDEQFGPLRRPTGTNPTGTPLAPRGRLTHDGQQ